MLEMCMGKLLWRVPVCFLIPLIPNVYSVCRHLYRNHIANLWGELFSNITHIPKTVLILEYINVSLTNLSSYELDSLESLDFLVNYRRRNSN